MRYGYSFIESAAIEIGSDILVVSSFGDYSFNRVQSAALPETMGGFPITADPKDETNSRFHIELGKTESLVVKTFKDMVSVSLNGTRVENFGESMGMLGRFGDGAKVARDGSTILNDPTAFAMEWQVRPDVDGSLFHLARHPQFPVQCILPSPTKRDSRRLRGSISEEQAELACEHLVDDGERARCVFDVLGTQDLDLAAGAY